MSVSVPVLTRASGSLGIEEGSAQSVHAVHLSLSNNDRLNRKKDRETEEKRKRMNYFIEI